MEDMVTVYSLDGDGIALVHFCPTNNQPQMRVVPATGNPKELAFDFVSAVTFRLLPSGHQHHLVIRFEDSEHITEAWTWHQDGMDMPWFSIWPARRAEALFPLSSLSLPAP